LIVLPFAPTVFDRHVATLHVAGLGQTLTEYRHVMRIWPRRTRMEIPDHRHRWLLRSRRERPRRRRAADERHERAPSPVEHGASRALGHRKRAQPSRADHITSALG